MNYGELLKLLNQNPTAKLVSIKSALFCFSQIALLEILEQVVLDRIHKGDTNLKECQHRINPTFKEVLVSFSNGTQQHIWMDGEQLLYFLKECLLRIRLDFDYSVWQHHATEFMRFLSHSDHLILRKKNDQAMKSGDENYLMIDFLEFIQNSKKEE